MSKQYPREPGTLAEFCFGDAGFNEKKVVDLVTNERVHWRCVTGALEWISTEGIVRSPHGRRRNSRSVSRSL